MAGATDEAIDEAERLLGVQFPGDYRAFVATENGVASWFGNVYLMLYPVESLPDLNQVHDHSSYLPGFAIIGSDGAAELFGFDFRVDPVPVVMVNNVSGGWEDAIRQAESFREFMEGRRRGEPFDFGVAP